MLKVKRADIPDRDIVIAVADIGRKQTEIAEECLEVWESMGGKLPSFEGFCRMYMVERFKEWVKKGRWN